VYCAIVNVFIQLNYKENLSKVSWRKARSQHYCITAICGMESTPPIFLKIGCICYEMAMQAIAQANHVCSGCSISHSNHPFNSQGIFTFNLKF
jgi:hypothetical protein